MDEILTKENRANRSNDTSETSPPHPGLSHSTVPATRAARGVFAAICVLQIVGIAGSVVAAAIDIETILAAGPIFSGMGLIVALRAWASRSVANVVFGLSAAAMSVFLFCLIVSLGWGPGKAQVPVSVILIAYELVIVPIGLFSLFRILKPAPKDLVTRFPQYSLRSLFLLMSLTAVAAAGSKTLYNAGVDAYRSVATVLWIATVLATICVVVFALRGTRE